MTFEERPEGHYKSLPLGYPGKENSTGSVKSGSLLGRLKTYLEVTVAAARDPGGGWQEMRSER